MKMTQNNKDKNSSASLSKLAKKLGTTKGFAEELKFIRNPRKDVNMKMKAGKTFYGRNWYNEIERQNISRVKYLTPSKKRYYEK